MEKIMNLEEISALLFILVQAGCLGIAMLFAYVKVTEVEPVKEEIKEEIIGE